MSRKSITYTSDILKAVAKEVGVPISTVEHVMVFITARMKGMMKDPEIMAIKLPYLGHIYEKQGPLISEVKAIEKFENKQTPKNIIKKAKFEKRIAEIEEASKTIGYSLHKAPSKFTSYAMNGKKSMQEVEEYQNTKWI